MSNKIYITCISWEERFIETFKHNLNTNSYDRTISFLVEEFEELCIEGIKKRDDLISNQGNVKHPLFRVTSRDDISTWKIVSDCLKNVKSDDNVVLDISTMPRYLIWFILHFLHSASVMTKISYCSPKSYCEKQTSLTREPLEPRLILKHSGEFLPGRNTIIIAQIGFDYDRLIQLIISYEPETVILAVQAGKQFDNIDRHKKERAEKLKFPNIDYISVDAFGDDHGFSEIEQKIKEYLDFKNIILASMGPKIMTPTMYKLNTKYPATGLVDVPVGQYSPEYSKGASCTNMISVDMSFHNQN